MSSNIGFEYKFSKKNVFKLKYIFEKASVLLILANLLSLTIAVLNNWNIKDLMWVYWLQSVIIGYFQFRKILDLKKFSTKNFYIGSRPAKPTVYTKKFTAYFFLFHYGFFHLVYFFFLLSASSVRDIMYFLVLGLSFFINHSSSYSSNKSNDSNQVKNIGQMMFVPYFRIIPMHLMIGSASVFNINNVFIFVGLKTIADLGMHIVEHGSYQKKRPI